MDEVRKQIRHERDLEIVKMLENSIMLHIEEENCSHHVKLLKIFIEALKKKIT